MNLICSDDQSWQDRCITKSLVYVFECLWSVGLRVYITVVSSKELCAPQIVCVCHRAALFVAMRKSLSHRAASLSISYAYFFVVQPI